MAHVLQDARLQTHCCECSLDARGHLARREPEASQAKSNVGPGGRHHHLVVRVLEDERARCSDSKAAAIWAQQAATNAQQCRLPGGALAPATGVGGARRSAHLAAAVRAKQHVQRAAFDAQRRLAQRLHAFVPSTEPHAQVLGNERVARGFRSRAPRLRSQRSPRSPGQRGASRRCPTTRAKLVKQAHMRLRLHVRLHARVRHRKHTRLKLLLTTGLQQTIHKSEGVVPMESCRARSIESTLCVSPPAFG